MYTVKTLLDPRNNFDDIRNLFNSQTLSAEGKAVSYTLFLFSGQIFFDDGENQCLRFQKVYINIKLMQRTSNILGINPKEIALNLHIID